MFFLSALLYGWQHLGHGARRALAPVLGGLLGTQTGSSTGARVLSCVASSTRGLWIVGLPSTARGLLSHGEEPLPPEAYSGDRRQAHAYAAARWGRATLVLPTGRAATALHRMATGATVEPVPPWILSGCMTNANSWTFLAASSSSFRFSRR
jgi:hypothetical protein